MLKETLVVAIGEFGRSPAHRRVSTSGNTNSPDGRDHWPYCYSAVVAGAGIARGMQYGESDADGIVAEGKAGASERSAGDGLLRARHRPGHGDPQSPESAARTGEGDACHGSLVLVIPMRSRVFYLLWAAVMIFTAAHLAGQGGRSKPATTSILINTARPAPPWALAEREMLEAAADGARRWVERYVQSDGSVNVPERWGVTDGPDDIMETVRGWPLVYAMGAPESVAEAYDKVWEGHLRQFSRAKIPAVELAKDGIFVKEFPPSFDWEHTGEGLQAFYWDGLGRPNNQASLARARRFAGFYLNEDPGAPNYDPKLKIIKSLFNGSIGPITRPVTPVDWDGDENPKRAARFSTSSNIRGDHPLNLLATTLATQAYLLTHEPKYKRWVLEYVDAWRDRAAANGGNFPSNIGLDGKIGGEWGGQVVRRNIRLEQPR